MYTKLKQFYIEPLL